MKRAVFIIPVFIALFCLTGASTAATKFDIEESLNFNEPWVKASRSDEENFRRLVEGLKKYTTGKKVIAKATEKAAQQGLTLFDVVAIGDGSLTDTTLIRRFSASNPANVMYETKSKVYLNKHLKTLDAL